jgi:hypothetical protein
LIEIQEAAFSECDFKQVVIPKNVVTIGKDAFKKNKDLSSVYLYCAFIEYNDFFVDAK